MTRIVCSILLTFLLAATTPRVAAADAITGRADLSRTDITVTDRVTLTVTLDSDPAFTVEPWVEAATTQLQNAGWTIVSTTTDAPALVDSGRIVHTTRFVLEPFLSGEYAVPEITCTVVGPDGEPHSVTLPASRVEVRSILPEDETDQLPVPGVPIDDTTLTGGDQPLGTLRPAPEPAPPGPPVLTLGLIAGLVTLAAACLFVARGAIRELTANREPDVCRELERRARAARTLDDLGPVDRALRAVLHASPPAANGAARRGADLLDRLERIRYAPTREHADPRALAKEAADIARAVRGASRGGAA